MTRVCVAIQVPGQADLFTHHVEQFSTEPEALGERLAQILAGRECRRLLESGSVLEILVRAPKRERS